MRCKPGDLAVVLPGTFPDGGVNAAGFIVSVIELVAPLGSVFNLGGGYVINGPVWHCSAAGIDAPYYSQDSYLQPIRGVDIKEKEDVADLP